MSSEKPGLPQSLHANDNVLQCDFPAAFEKTIVSSVKGGKIDDDHGRNATGGDSQPTSTTQQVRHAGDLPQLSVHSGCTLRLPPAKSTSRGSSPEGRSRVLI
eukprot:gnl/TRDRNA2_/TRDRNA2_175749_c0_seq4.p1 gnl/TRDRNA2_/TRDRNA2_175749_c0~~gnl/TRDRNA2_/TRDRNA2_175749_c0_seq4.p1  ORF type:complete len:102 (-),score=8.41 gnl/TRDRNA2_/TRDRNA2_175749_c0_seq4:283-588(-)